MEDCPNARAQEEQAGIAPEEAVQMLKDGNARFVNNNMTNYCYGKMAEQTAHNGQFPFAAVLCCVDSRASIRSSDW
jgi:carbonic anhydrase